MKKIRKKYRWKFFLLEFMVFGPIFWWLSVFASNAQTPLSRPLKELLMNCVECMKTTGGASKTCHNPSISSIDPLLSFVPPHVIFFFLLLLPNLHSSRASFQKETSNFMSTPTLSHKKSCPQLWQHLFREKIVFFFPL